MDYAKAILNENLFIKGDEDCAICIENISPEQLEVLECGHHFHSNCIMSCFPIIGQKIKCPICRQFSR